MNRALLDSDTYSEILRAVNTIVIGHAHTYRQAYGTLTLSEITVAQMAAAVGQSFESLRDTRFTAVRDTIERLT